MSQRSLILSGAGGSILLICLCYFIHLPPYGRRETILSRFEVARCLEDFRPPAGRLVGFAHAHSIPPSLGVERRIEIRQLLRISRQEADYHSEPWTQANRAVVELLVGDPERAIVLLESAASMQPRDARIYSDLSAAYLSRARRSHRPLDLMRGLAAARRALELDPALQEGAFNCAVAFDLLQLSRKSMEAWGQYLLLDSGSWWAEEARARRDTKKVSEEERWNDARNSLLRAAINHDSQTVARFIARFSQPSQGFALETLLPDWGSAISATDSHKAEQLSLAVKEVGSALAEFNKDYEVLDAAREVEQARSSSQRQVLLAEGYQLYRSGRNLQLQYRSAEAVSVLTRAAEILGENSPMAHWAKLYKAVALMDLHRIVPALETIDALSREVDGSRYRSLAGKIQWIRGMLLFKISQPVLALNAFLKAIDIYRSISAWEDLCATHYIAAETLEYLGSSGGSSEHLWQSLSLFGHLINDWRLFAFMDELADSAQREGLPEVALDFRDEVVHILTRLRLRPTRREHTQHLWSF